MKIQSIDYGDHWEVLINGGWWAGRGETKQKTIDASVKRMQDELGYFGQSVEVRPVGKYIQEEMF